MLYSEDHEYLLSTSDPKVYKLGISSYAAKLLGDITYVELPTAGETYEAHGNLGAVESVKAASDIYAPAELKVLKVNEVLEDKAVLVGEDPEGEGWIAEVEVTGDLSGLMDEGKYKEFTEMETEEK